MLINSDHTKVKTDGPTQILPHRRRSEARSLVM